jgi:hypothetical protein
MRTLSSLLVAALVCLLCLVGCGRKRTPIAEDALPDPPAAVFHHGPALTDEEARRFAERVEKTARDNDPQGLARLFDQEALFERALSGISAPPRVLEALRRDARQSSGLTHLTVPVTRAVSNGGSYRLLRVHQEGDEKRVLFRLLHPEAGVNYHDLVLARDEDGQVRAIDLYTFLSGELGSRSIRRLLLPVAAQASRGLIDRLAGADQDLIRHLPTYKRLIQAFKENNHAEVLAQYDRLPPSLQKDKNVLILRLQAAQNVGDDAHQAAYDALARHFPDDPCLDLNSIAPLLHRKRYRKALEAVERLDRAVEGDPYLDSFRSTIHLEAGRVDQARAAQRVVKSLPDLQSSYWPLVAISLREKDHEETARLLSDIEKRFDVDLDNLEKEPDYRDFVKSAVYKKWRHRNKDD